MIILFIFNPLTASNLLILIILSPDRYSQDKWNFYLSFQQASNSFIHSFPVMENLTLHFLLLGNHDFC